MNRKPQNPVPRSGPVLEYRLENGLKILLQQIPGPGVVSIWCWYRVGSRDERPGITGIAHWVEHMNFKGTERIPKEEIKNRIELVGGAWNGYTYLDVTTYLETVPGKALNQMIELEAERMVHCLYDPAEVEKERTVVISELQGGENDPRDFLDKEITGTALQAHPYRWPTIGYLSDLESITRDDLETFYRTYYVPNNATLVIVGDFEPEAALAEIRKQFGPIPPGGRPARIRTVEPEPSGEKRVELRRPGTTAYLQAAFHAPAITEADFFPLLMADAVLAGGRSLNIWSSLGGDGLRKSSRLYRALIDTGYATQVSTSLLPTTYPFLYTLQATIREGASLDETEEVLLRELSRLGREPVSEREFTKAMNQIRARFVFDSDSVTEIAHQLGFFETIDSYKTFQQIPERLAKVTPDEIRRVARKTFSDRRRTVGRLLPTSGDAGAKAIGQASPPRLRRARQTAVRSLQFSPAGGADARGLDGLRPIRQVLTNGLVLIVQPVPALPSITALLTVKAGSLFDPRGGAGTAHFTSMLLDRGTDKFGKEELAENLDYLGAQFSHQVDAHTVSLGSTLLPEHLPEVLDFLQEIVRRPIFPAEEVEKVRAEILTGIGEEDDDTSSVALRGFQEKIYPDGHPYRHPVNGYRESVKAIRREHLQGFHRVHFRPDAAFLVIVGGIDAETALAETRKAFGSWETHGAAPPVEIPPVDLPEAGSTRTFPMSNKTQVDVALGFRGISRSHPDYYPALLMSHVLGQFGMGGRIGHKIRDTEGLAYYANFQLLPGLGEGAFLARLGVNPSRVEKAVQLLREELERMHRDGASDREVENSRRYLSGSLALRLETNEGIAGFLAQAELHQLGIDFHRRYPEILESVTTRQVNDAARTHLHPDRAALILAGPMK
ncbi:MAG: pitrilysin family protein [Acidobacteriota bacterium]